MRFFSLALFATAAVAGSQSPINHAEALSRVQATEFGATVLADLQDRLNVADPVTALREFIEKIRKRISDESITDGTEQKLAADAFAENLASTDVEIDAAIAEINTCTGEIAKQQGIIEEKYQAMIAKKIQIRDTEAAIAYNQESIENGDALRKENEEVWVAATVDAKNVRAAVEEILAIEKGSKLHANQEEKSTLGATYDAKGAMTLDRVADVKASLLSVNALTKLQETAATVTDPTAQSFIQLAALSAQAFGGDIDELRTLLNRLIQEVDSFTAALKSENESNKADWDTLRDTMTAEIVDWQADLIRLDGELTVLRTALAVARDALTVAIKCYNTQRMTLQSLYSTKTEILTSASDAYTAFLEKEALRAEELETLQLIYEIIKDKLEDANTNIKDNVEDLLKGDSSNLASHCHCDHACQVFDDCCPKCDFDNLPAVAPTWNNGEPVQPVVYEGGEKEIPSRSEAHLLSTYMGDGNGFHF